MSLFRKELQDCPYRVEIETIPAEGDDPLPRIGQAISIVTRTFPFHFGRDGGEAMEHHVSGDGVLLAEVPPYHASRNHCVIEWTEDGGLVLRDCGSTLGTMVDGTFLSRKRARFNAPLALGEHKVRIGGPRSPHWFRVVVSKVRKKN